MTTPGPSTLHRNIIALALLVSLAAHAVVMFMIGALPIGALGSNYGSSDDSAVAPRNDDALLILAELPERSSRPQPEPFVDGTAPDAQPSEGISERLADRLAAPTPSMQDRLAERLRDRLGSGAAPTTTTAAAPTDPALASVSFVGVRAENAPSVAYVVDASGSLVSTFPLILDELQRSLEHLAPEQRFGVVFFQRNGAVVAPGENALRTAAPNAVRDELAWVRANVRPSGRSNPLGALDTALGWKPDVIFLLSTSITGSGEFEISREELLARVDALNPVDASGTRRTRIHCIQFLDPDPLDTLRRLAENHGGEKGFRFLSREELGLKGDPRPERSAGSSR